MTKTKTTERVTVRTKLTTFLAKHEGKAFDAPTLAKRLKLNYNTVRKELGALYNTFMVEKGRHKGRLRYERGIAL